MFCNYQKFLWSYQRFPPTRRRRVGTAPANKRSFSRDSFSYRMPPRIILWPLSFNHDRTPVEPCLVNAPERGQINHDRTRVEPCLVIVPRHADILLWFVEESKTKEKGDHVNKIKKDVNQRRFESSRVEKFDLKAIQRKEFLTRLFKISPLVRALAEVKNWYA